MSFLLASSPASVITSPVIILHNLPKFFLIAIVNPELVTSLLSLSSHRNNPNEFKAGDQQKYSQQQLQLLSTSLNSIPEIFRFSMSGCLGSMLFLLLERLIHSVLTNWGPIRNHRLRLHILGVMTNETLSFVIAYILHVIPQHLLHAVLVYGMQTISTRDQYLKSLMGCYST
jgi:hypothetical protein